MHPNGDIIAPAGSAEGKAGVRVLEAPSLMMTVRPIGDESDWRQGAEPVFALDEGLTAGFCGFYCCER